MVTMGHTLADALRERGNDYRPHIQRFTDRTALDWHALTPPGPDRTARLSIVIPTHNNAHSLGPVLDALAAANTAASVEVIVVDDASTDHTPAIIAAHHTVDTAVRLPHQVGAATARNLGIAIAEGDTIVHLDADMVLPDHVLADIGARAADDLVLVGFRHNIAYQPDASGRPTLPPGEPDLEQDHRVNWRAPANQPMFYSGQTYTRPIHGRPLDHTRDWIDLGNAAIYHDWDLPRMVVTALVAVPRAVALDVGGFDTGFGIGWSTEDTHLGAALIAAGCTVVPLRQARGYHLDPPHPGDAWKAKFATAAPRVAYYRRLLAQPPPTGRRAAFRAATHQLLARTRRLR
ncbi:glycosyltransferase [Solwaraspora sp. WMMD1047]|uniref:glycosyltransferase family 2 protein n=1 Tax=Solwaraspora sp. WMMD1047 TaxID=3016102 RepID=UPI002416FEC3|nr:glycosyltransferase [Solwaraspora sp. WMMD1047]MDG4830010.1 glycosyltransferase [Solwaraspora sp. WMMD1047]